MFAFSSNVFVTRKKMNTAFNICIFLYVEQEQISWEFLPFFCAAWHGSGRGRHLVALGCLRRRPRAAFLLKTTQNHTFMYFEVVPFCVLQSQSFPSPFEAVLLWIGMNKILAFLTPIFTTPFVIIIRRKWGCGKHNKEVICTSHKRTNTQVALRNLHLISNMGNPRETHSMRLLHFLGAFYGLEIFKRTL